MTDERIREIFPSDFDAACEIVAQHSPADAKHARRAFEREWVLRAAGLSCSLHRVVEFGSGFVGLVGSGLVGLGGWFTDEIGIPWLTWMYVDAAHRRGGIATRLLECVVRDLQASEHRKLYVGTGTVGYEAAVAFYERSGFVRQTVLPNYGADDGDCLIMAKPLR